MSLSTVNGVENCTVVGFNTVFTKYNIAIVYFKIVVISPQIPAKLKRCAIIVLPENTIPGNKMVGIDLDGIIIAAKEALFHQSIITGRNTIAVVVPTKEFAVSYHGIALTDNKTIHRSIGHGDSFYQDIFPSPVGEFDVVRVFLLPVRDGFALRIGNLFIHLARDNPTPCQFEII